MQIADEGRALSPMLTATLSGVDGGLHVNYFYCSFAYARASEQRVRETYHALWHSFINTIA
jgi:hypothetical protein